MLRRRLLQLLSISPAFRTLRAARAEFWKIKDPAKWSSEEKRILLSQSPWAREGLVTFDSEPHRQPASGPYEVPASKPGGMPDTNPSVPIGEKMPPRPQPPGQPVQFRVAARWETAAPVHLAGGPDLPPDTATFYVIGLWGVPLMPVKQSAADPNPNQTILEAIQHNSRLEREHGAPIACSHLLTGSRASAAELLLFFPRGTDPITLGDRVVSLESRFGPYRMSVKFPLKDMLYRGELAL